MDKIILNSAEMQNVDSNLFLYCMSDHTKQEYTCRICALKIFKNILSFICLQYIVSKFYSALDSR